MNRTTRLLVVLVLAIGVGAAASFAVYKAVSRMPVREVEVATIQTVVASVPVPVGTILSKDHVKTVPWPSRNQVPDSFTTVDPVLNRGAVVAISVNEPITESKLAPQGAGGGLPPTIPEGMRAISVRTNEVIGVAGFVVPGTRVDVVVVLKATGNESISRVVVSNVQVLTAGTRFDQEKARQEGKPIPTSVVTLLVTPEDAEKIALAADQGQITLTLRNPLDTSPTDTKGVRMTTLMAAPSPAPVVQEKEGRRVVRTPRPPEPPPPPRTYTVETIRAAKRTEEQVK